MTKKSEIYTEPIYLTVTPEQKEAIKQISRLYENSLIGYLRHMINVEMRKHEVGSNNGNKTI